MEWTVIGLTIIYLVIVIRIYVKYNKDEKPCQKLEYYREKLEITPSEAAFLCDKNAEGIYLILADLLSLVNKNQVKLEIIPTNGDEKEYVFYKNPDIDLTKLKNHEAMSYELFFDMQEGNDKVYLSDFLSKIENDKMVYRELKIKHQAILYSIRMELEKQGIFDGTARKKMQNINGKCIGWGIFAVILLVISFIVKNNIFSQIAYITTLFIFILYNITNIDESKITQKGADILEQSKALRNYIKDYIIVDDKPIYTVNILDYYYTMAIAFGMADLGRKEFYKDSIKKASRETKIRNYKKICLILIGLAILLGLGYWIYMELRKRVLLTLVLFIFALLAVEKEV